VVVLEQVDLQVCPSVDPLTELVITGTQDSANKIYTLSSQLSAGEPTYFFINGQLLTYNNDYSISGTHYYIHIDQHRKHRYIENIW
jgi:hypothetical protein